MKMNPLLLIVSSVIGGIGIIIFYKIVWIACIHYTMRKKINHIPGTTDYSFFEVLYMSTRPQKEHMKLFLSILHKNKDGLYTSWIKQYPVVYVFKPEFVKSILQDHTHIEKSELYAFLKLWLGNGLITAPVQQWYKYRKLLLPTFQLNISKHCAIMFEKAEIVIKCIEKKLDENSTKVIDIIPFMQKITFNIMCEIMMGVNVDDEEFTLYQLIIKRYMKLNWLYTKQPWFWIYNWIYGLSSQGREYKATIKNIHNFTNKVIQKKKLARIQNNKSNNKQNDSGSEDNQGKKTFLDLLLDMNEKDSTSLTNKELRGHVNTIIFARFPSVWTLFCIGNDLECQEKIHEELKKVFKDSQKPPSVEELSQLKYLERVIKETRRLYPSIPTIMRKISEDIKLDNYIIPKGTSVTVPIMLIHRNPAVWSDPLKFDPDRFLPENLKQIHPYAYIPFSSGPRNCIGQKFAIIEEKIILAAILRKWRVKSMKTHEEITMSNQIILRPSQQFLYLFPKE